MMSTFTMHSTSIKANEQMPKHFLYNLNGCQGDNISPELEWKGAPSETKSFAVTVFDPDASNGHGWWHWAVINIPQNVNKIEEGASNSKKLPRGAIELETDFHKKGYGGPCPPKGDRPHRYVFTIYALNLEKLDVEKNATASEIKTKLEKNCLAKTDFTVEYGR
ncbi:MAG: YbhB/YbcL family Raf kinase inhibitor-like protein [Bacteriovoracaceae bacterium]